MKEKWRHFGHAHLIGFGAGCTEAHCFGARAAGASNGFGKSFGRPCLSLMSETIAFRSKPLFGVDVLCSSFDADGASMH